MRLGSVVLAVWLSFASVAAARDLFVDNVAGNDLNDGAAARTDVQGSGPTRTLARALRAANHGDRIVLTNTGVPYRESVTLQAAKHSGEDYAPFTIVGNGAILDGRRSVPPHQWEPMGDDVFRFRPERLSYQQLYLADRPAERRQLESPDQRPNLEPLQWCMWQYDIYFRVEPNRLPHDYDLSCCYLQVGIGLYEVRHVVISDLTVQGFWLDGINAHDNAWEVLIDGVTSRGNGRSGLSVGGTSRVTLQASLIGNNGAAQVRTEGRSTTRIIASDLLPSTAPPVVREAGQVLMENEP